MMTAMKTGDSGRERLISTGISGLDAAFGDIGEGSNVIFRVTHMREFRAFLDPFTAASRRAGRKIVYIRFGNHPPLVSPESGVTICGVPLSHLFESFSVEIHDIIEREGDHCSYVFDCLSDLQTAWATDMMMGNFFRVICPELARHKAAAYFPVLHGRHSAWTVQRLRETADYFINLYPSGRDLFFRCEKAGEDGREAYYKPYRLDTETGEFREVNDGVRKSRFYQALNNSQSLDDNRSQDSWDRFFDGAYAVYQAGMNMTEACRRMCDIMMTRDPRIREMIRVHFSPRDYFLVRERMIGTGLIGGKACGMLLARSIIENDEPDLFEKLEPHDSFYVGSDVFYTYIVENDFWHLRLSQRREDGYFSLAEAVRERFLKGRFSPEMENQFRRMLEYYGHDPIIVRSSSILEDGFGNAFAGKYESVFCANTGTMAERLAELENAMRIVYASTMSLSALDYRKRRGLDRKDEQMALLVQRVSGSVYGDYYLPAAAGVGYSLSPYRFLASLDPRSGMLRLVMGLGTSAVDRTEGSYPRLVSLDQPEKTAAVSEAEKHQFSQRRIGLVNMKTRCQEQVLLEKLLDVMPDYLKKALLSHDFDAERRFRERGRRRDVYYISCDGLTRNEELMAFMRRMLSVLQEQYQYPVDTEFAVNLSENGEFVVNMLQCRPLQVFHDTADTGEDPMAELPEDQIFLSVRGASMGMSRRDELDVLVYVDPIAYYTMPFKEKPAVAAAIHAVNWHYRGSGRTMMLMVPGRVGTSSPELGVPTTFSDISEFRVVAEIAESRVGYRPELSYGSHFFQDLVEAEILYTAVFEDKAKTLVYRPEMLAAYENRLADIYPAGRELSAVVSVCEVSGSIRHHMPTEETVILLKKPGDQSKKENENEYTS